MHDSPEKTVSTASPLTAVGGQMPEGADVLRERLRWSAAERRWHPQPLPWQPVVPPVGRVVLRHGAQLTRYTDTLAGYAR